jgi:hypothetical protein
MERVVGDDVRALPSGSSHSLNKEIQHLGALFDFVVDIGLQFWFWFLFFLLLSAFRERR